uniref:Uncharacterized protein n=1 Tax=viral metagenome TaxID=1070528 RepID=A0A6C0IG66_9ZZZZ
MSTKKRKAITTPGTPETPRIPSIPQQGLPSTVQRRIRLIQQENPQKKLRHRSTQYPHHNNKAIYSTNLYNITNNHGRNYTIAHTRKKPRYTSPLTLSPVNSPNHTVSPTRQTNNRKPTPKNKNKSHAVHNKYMNLIRAYEQTHVRKN